MGIYLKKTKTLIQKDMHMQMFIVALFTIAKIWKQPVFIYRWMDKEVVYICNGIHSIIKKEWNLAISDNMDGPIGYYAKWNKSDREGQKLYSLIYMQNLK